MELSERVKTDQEKFLRDQQERLEKAAQFLLQELRKVLSVQGPPGEHAPPGQPPFRQTGRLLKSYKIRLEKDRAVIYSDLPYARWVERNHPYFLETINRLEPIIRDMIFKF